MIQNGRRQLYLDYQFIIMRFLKITSLLKKIEKFNKVEVSPYQYRPPRMLTHYNVQVLYSLLTEKAFLNYQREKIFFEDGGHISLDWLNKDKDQETNPVVMIMHGMTGGSNAGYIKVLAKQIQDKGYTVVCLNSRGFNSIMTSPIPFIGLHFTQLQAALARIKLYFPKRPLYMIGLSLGGNYLMRYLMRNNHQNLLTPTLKALILVSPPFDVKHVMYNMHIAYQKLFVKFYQQSLVFKHQKMKFWQEIGLVDFQHLKRSQNLDNIKLVGMPINDLFDHFKIQNQQIENFKIKSLIISAKDDPMVDYLTIPDQFIRRNNQIKFILTQNGSHLGWIQGVKGQRWYPKPILRFIQDIQNNNQIHQI